MRLLIAIPVYNEKKYVGPVLDKIKSFHPDVLVVDDGSSDGTSDILAARAGAGDIHLIRHQTNAGYGQSIIDAFDFADRGGFDWVITMDCDEQHEPEQIPRFIEAMEADRWDLISGSRYLEARGDDDLPPGDRRTINATLTGVLNGLFRLGITDAFCGYKAHRMSAMRRLRLDVPGYAFPMQLWPQAHYVGLRIRELPVRLIYNDPNRHFGGTLDDAGNRLRHYLAVLHEELDRLWPGRKVMAPVDQQEAAVSGAAPAPAPVAAAREGLDRPENASAGKRLLHSSADRGPRNGKGWKAPEPAPTRCMCGR